MVQRVVINAHVTRDLYHDLRRVFPEGCRQEGWFRCELPLNDTHVRMILLTLEQGGFLPWQSGISKEGARNRFFYDIHRDYNAADLADAEYLRIMPKSKGNGLFRNDKGLIRMMKGQFPRKADFIRTALSWIVVPERVKRLIEAQGFEGVLFRPTVLMGGSRRESKAVPIDWAEVGEPWWELTSQVVLPPMAPTMDLYNDDGEPVQHADCSRGCHAREGHYAAPEFRYRRSDLKPVEPFDFARTTELFGPAGHVDTWRHIASQRLYRFCIDSGFACDWVPVRLDD